MKKNLRNILALALGLMTTVSFAQDMNVDSRTRIDMSGDGEKMSTAQKYNIEIINEAVWNDIVATLPNKRFLFWRTASNLW